LITYLGVAKRGREKNFVDGKRRRGIFDEKFRGFVVLLVINEKSKITNEPGLFEQCSPSKATALRMSSLFDSILIKRAYRTPRSF